MPDKYAILISEGNKKIKSPGEFQIKMMTKWGGYQYPLIPIIAEHQMNWIVEDWNEYETDFDFIWQEFKINSEMLQSLELHQKINHFPEMRQITKKKNLANNLKRLKKMYPLEYDFFPRTWVVPNELNELRLYVSARSK